MVKYPIHRQFTVLRGPPPPALEHGAHYALCTDLRAGLGAHVSPSSSLHSASLAATACCATAAPSGAPVPARLRAVTSICAARCCTSRTRAAPTAPAVLAAPAVALAPAQRALVHAAAKHATSRLSSSAAVPPCGWRSAAAHGSSHACAPVGGWGAGLGLGSRLGLGLKLELGRERGLGFG